MYYFIIASQTKMSNTYSLMRQVLAQMEEFEQEKSDFDSENSLQEFAVWLYSKFGRQLSNQPVAPDMSGESPSVALARLVVYMYRYTKNYSKKALEGSGLQSMEEFGYLATLLSGGSMSKTELIKQNIQEITTGTEIIKRLIKAGYIEQTEDKSDRRSKVLHITSEGSKQLFAAIVRLNPVTEIITGELKQNEIEKLVELLSLLHEFHYKIYAGSRHHTFDSIIKSAGRA